MHAQFLASTTSSSTSHPVGAIVGGVIGGLVLVALLAVGFWMWRRRRRLNRRPSSWAVDESNAPPDLSDDLSYPYPFAHPRTQMSSKAMEAAMESRMLFTNPTRGTRRRTISFPSFSQRPLSSYEPSITSTYDGEEPATRSAPLLREPIYVQHRDAGAAPVIDLPPAYGEQTDPSEYIVPGP